MAGIWEQFSQRKASSSIQFIKYAICGGAATAVHIVIFYLLSWLVLPAISEQDIFVRLAQLSPSAISDALRARNAMINNGLAFIFSNLTAYLLNIIWVFESGRRYPPVDFTLDLMGFSPHAALRSGVHRTVEVILFYAVSGIAMVVGTVLLGVLINNLHLTTTTAFGVEVVVAVLINYALRKFVIFKG